MPHIRRRLVATLVILPLLFAQFAVAGYRCAGMTAAPCEQMDMRDAEQGDEPLLCAEHCRFGQQSVNAVLAGADFAAALPVLLFALPEIVAALPAASHVQPALLAHAIAPPEYARTRRLRL
jgi:hypothetical protein